MDGARLDELLDCLLFAMRSHAFPASGSILDRRHPSIFIQCVRRPPRGDARTEKSYSICVVAGAFWPHRSGNDILQE
eukprot:821278-Pyramimonas_sp.AAC.1